MILPFSTKFKNGTPTNFIHKIRMAVGCPYCDEIQDLSGMNISKCNSCLHHAMFDPKLHTIREDKHDRWHAGRLIHPVVNNRSKNQFQFAPAFPCVSTQEIEVRHYSHETWCEPEMINAEYYDKKCGCNMERYYNVIVDGKMLKTDEVIKLSKNDGFASTNDFFSWFNPNNLEFLMRSEKIIHWTDLKY